MAEDTPHGLGYCRECFRRVPRTENGTLVPHQFTVNLGDGRRSYDCDGAGKSVSRVPLQWADVTKGHVITVYKSHNRRPFKMHVHSIDQRREGSTLGWVVGDRLTMGGKASGRGATIGHSGRRELVSIDEVIGWETDWVPYRLVRRSADVGGGFHVVDIATRRYVGWVLPADGQWGAYVQSGWKLNEGRPIGRYATRKEAVGEVWINRQV